jgi:Matrixin/IPT/TIG domain
MPALLKNGLTLAAAVAVLGFVLAGEWESVRAYTTYGGAWPGSTAPYRINANFPDPSAGTPADQIAAVQAAADAWHVQTGIDFSFAYAGTTSVATVAYDGTNAIFYSHTDGGGALAVCYYWMGGGSLYQFDIQFFDRAGLYDFVWAVTPNMAQFDIQSVATHELGHALGLGHSAIGAATMYPTIAPGDVSRRTLDIDDINGALSIYGTAPVTPSVTGCSPSSMYIDGGSQVTITGTNFSATGLSIQIGGVAAINPTYISPTQIACTVPPGILDGQVPVQVCCGTQCASAPVFSYTTIRVFNPPTLGGVSRVDFKVPAMAGKAFQAYGSLGTVGIPLSSWLNPLDPRILPLTYDTILVWNALANPSWFAYFNGNLNAAGVAHGFFGVPPTPQVQGVTFHFAFLVWDASSQSGVGHVSTSVGTTVQ